MIVKTKKKNLRQVNKISHSADKGCNNRILCQSIPENCNMQVQDQNIKSSVYRSCTVVPVSFPSYMNLKKLIGKVHIMFGGNFSWFIQVWMTLIFLNSAKY